MELWMQIAIGIIAGVIGLGLLFGVIWLIAFIIRWFDFIIEDIKNVARKFRGIKSKLHNP